MSEQAASSDLARLTAVVTASLEGEGAELWPAAFAAADGKTKEVLTEEIQTAMAEDAATMALIDPITGAIPQGDPAPRFSDFVQRVGG